MKGGEMRTPEEADVVATEETAIDCMANPAPLESLLYVVVEDENCPNEWRAEAIDDAGEGECYVVIFAGPRAEERAREYAQWKNEPPRARPR